MSSGKTTQKLMCCIPILEARHAVKNLELHDVSA